MRGFRDTRNAEIQNYLGYAYRNSGELPLAFKHYARALQLNPRHRGAHEYLSEAYLMIGNRAKAEEHLALLKGSSLIPCAENRRPGEKDHRIRQTVLTRARLLYYPSGTYPGLLTRELNQGGFK